MAASLNIALMTVSNRHTPETDTSGDYLAQALVHGGHHCVERKIITPDLWLLRQALCNWIADENIHVIISTGGTGFGPDKNTIAAIKPLLDQTIRGFGEIFRALSYHDIGSAAMQSDAIAGLANNKVIFCLPGANSACKLAWEALIGPQLDDQQKPCNFTGLFDSPH